MYYTGTFQSISLDRYRVIILSKYPVPVSVRLASPKLMKLCSLADRVADPHQFELLDPDPGGQK